MGTKFNDYLAEQLKDPEFRKEFEALQAERAAKKADHIPNEETIAALEEAKRMMADPDSKTYSAEEAIRELGKFEGKYNIPDDIDESNDEVLSLMENGGEL